ncbi:hypothetical protein [Deinococcus roseus]|uniref:Lipoprotein n=1 Tax=Deinococcus roseus TaxID=392414 RepID=A0ABQ2D1H7_9DEIO|nr:hypothetical protein [Deinococcus roseus]GGJ30461.1 hypothetical protein GCM10008938_15660 [Deinococcus roseus]
MKWKHLLLGSLTVGTIVSCNSTKLVPVAISAAVEGVTLKFDYTEDKTTHVVSVKVTRTSGKAIFTPLPGSAGLQLQRVRVDVYDETQALLGSVEHTMSGIINPIPLTGEEAGKPKTTEIAIPVDPVLPNVVEEYLNTSCLSAYVDPNRAPTDPVCPSAKVKYTFTGISMADGSQANVIAIANFQPTYSYQIEGGEQQ